MNIFAIITLILSSFLLGYGAGEFFTKLKLNKLYIEFMEFNFKMQNALIAEIDKCLKKLEEKK